MEVGELIEAKRICRTCLRIDTHLNPLFEQESVGGVSIPEMIAECTICPVDKADNYPDQICSKCIEDVKIAYGFKKLCEKSYDMLTTLIGKSKCSVDKDYLIAESEISNEEVKGECSLEESFAFYACDKCTDKFISYEDYKEHSISCHADTENKCRICSKVYFRLSKKSPTFSQSDLVLSENELCANCCTIHFNNYEENKDGYNIPWQYMCGSCEETFSTEDLFKEHNCEACNSIEVKSEEALGNNLLVETEIGVDPSIELEKSDSEIIVEENIIDDNHFSEYDSKMTMEPQEPDSSSTKEQTNEINSVIKTNIKPVKEQKGHKCPTCQRVFSRSTHLRRHMLTHSGHKPYVCNFCNKTFSRQDHLHEHMQNHLDLKTHHCEMCNKGFTRLEHLRRHKETRHGNKGKTPKTEFCEVCKKGFTTLKYLQIHMKSHTDRIWNCKFCPENFKTKPELTQHSKTHANEKPYLCSECGLRFVRNDYLVIHMRRHKGEKPYKCKFCGKGFPRATDLTVHERYHTGEKTHLCTVCGKGFQRAYNLLVHMRVHTGERPYQCPHCSKSFAQGNDLKAHIRRHTGERFKCDICGEGFIQGYHLTQHKRTIHGIDMKSHIRRVEKFTTPIEQQQQMEAIKNQLKEKGVEKNVSPRSVTSSVPLVSDEIQTANKTGKALGVIKIENDNCQTIRISSEQAEILQKGHSVEVVDNGNLAVVSQIYFTPLDSKIKFESSFE